MMEKIYDGVTVDREPEDNVTIKITRNDLVVVITPKYIGVPLDGKPPVTMPKCKPITAIKAKGNIQLPCKLVERLGMVPCMVSIQFNITPNGGKPTVVNWMI